MTNNNLKPIETAYKGYRFRSRLEARWAVFFDTLGIAWEYEKEGYDLGEAGWYLPDFWLPQVQMWAEVKPEEFDRTEIAKAQALAQASGFSVLELIGSPENKGYEAFAPIPEGMRITEAEDTDPLFEPGLPEDYHLTMWHGYPITEGRFYSCDRKAKFDDTERACVAARSARFEHGKKGAQ